MRILVRVELDITGPKPTENIRFEKAADSIKTLSKANNKLVLVAHRGRPGGKKVKKLSLESFVAPLSRAIGKRIVFLPKFDFKEISKQIEAAPKGTIFLLENIRFLPEEEKNGKRLAKQLASLADSYINNDFATSHRAHASIVGVAGLLPAKMGPHLKSEIKTLDRVSSKPRQPLVLLIGGAKTVDKLTTVRRLITKADFVLLGGGPANTLLKARGVRVGKSLYDRSAIKELGALVKNQKLITPVDWRVEKDAILDIGPATSKEYAEILREAKTIIWNGPMGVFERKVFSGGTEAAARAILANKEAFRVIGGGDTASALEHFGLISRFEKSGAHMSTGGGAMLTYLAGEKLPGIEALNK